MHVQQILGYTRLMTLMFCIEKRRKHTTCHGTDDIHATDLMSDDTHLMRFATDLIC